METEASHTTPALLFAGGEPISVTIPVAGDYSGLPRSTVCELIASGALETSVIGRRRLVIFTSLKNYILSQKSAGISPAATARAQRIRAHAKPKRKAKARAQGAA